MTQDAPSITGECHCSACRWTFNGDPGPATACNCTLCRRYGALWAYDYEGERIAVLGTPAAYRRRGKDAPSLEILFCPTCAGVLAWRGLRLDGEGRRRMAVNLRLAPPEAVAGLPIDHFDGLGSFEDHPRDGRCVRDLWF
ncbi:MAG TPA: GFA family protein [Novosphingobium sp.]|nr:GFA family protein [Novosphingobium sp.]